MILGYPGRTNRWVPSFWVDQNVAYAYPAWVEGSKTAMDAMKPFMDADDAVRLMYASKYAQIANYWKNRQGMIEALKAHKTADTKRSYEKKFAKWANKKKNRAEYGDVLKTMADYFEKTNVQSADNNYLVSLIRATDFVVLPQAITRAFQNYEQMPDEQKKQLISRLQNVLQIYKEKHIATEKAILADGLKLYATKAKNVPSEVKQIQTDYQSDFKKFANKAFETSVFGSEENFKAFLENPNAEVLKNDLLVQLSFALVDKYNHKSEEQIALQDSYEKAFRKFVKGMRVSKIGKTLYPDANSTLRLTYGTVRALPADKRNADASINNYTTFKSMIAKYKPNDPEFDMPKRMIEMYEAKDFGRYLDKDGTMHVNFLTDNDITGGNSGSPVMNGKGELIGLAFDGNIEAMAGDVIFDAKLQRTINVDIRYVLWVIDKFSGAKHIVDEMTIVE